MKRRTLPGTELSLSVVGFGCWTVGDPCWGPVDQARGIAAVRAAVERGITWFDTAPLYGEGASDRLLARALGTHIHKVVIATKVGARLERGAGAPRPVSDLRPAHVIADAEASLTRLGVERIDLLQVHWPCDLGTPLEDTLEALVRLVEAGKVRHFGLCNYGPEALARARELAPVVSLQAPYSLVNRSFEGDLRRAAEGLGVLAYGPLGRGLLSGKYSQPPRFAEADLRARDPRFSGPRFWQIQAMAADLGRAAERLGVSAAALAIAWVASRPGVTAALVGARSPGQVAENTRAAALVDRPAVTRVISGIAALHSGGAV